MEKLDINKHIGKVCQEYRLKNNLTQNQVSELTGLEPRHISQIERGLSKGSIDTLIKLCNAYHITPDVILYDLLDTNIKEAISIYDEDFKKLSKRDKESILYFIKFFIFYQYKYFILVKSRFAWPVNERQSQIKNAFWNF